MELSSSSGSCVSGHGRDPPLRPGAVLPGQGSRQLQLSSRGCRSRIGQAPRRWSESAASPLGRPGSARLRLPASARPLSGSGHCPVPTRAALPAGRTGTLRPGVLAGLCPACASAGPPLARRARPPPRRPRNTGRRLSIPGATWWCTGAAAAHKQRQPAARTSDCLPPWRTHGCLCCATTWGTSFASP